MRRTALKVRYLRTQTHTRTPFYQMRTAWIQDFPVVGEAVRGRQSCWEGGAKSQRRHFSVKTHVKMKELVPFGSRGRAPVAPP